VASMTYFALYCHLTEKGIVPPWVKLANVARRSEESAGF